MSYVLFYGLNWSKVKRSILIGSLTAHRLNSLICVLERISKENILTLSRNHFLLSDQKGWQKFCEIGAIKTNFLVGLE